MAVELHIPAMPSIAAAAARFRCTGRAGQARRWLLTSALLFGLAGCGGGGGGAPPAPQSCDAPARKSALSLYFDDWYFWTRFSPKPAPSGNASLDEYFLSLLYTGGDAAFPSDRWSFVDSTVNFNRFYGEGRTLGYGLFVAGIEVAGRPDQPLRVRYVEPQSPAALSGLARGDRILALNGRPVADVIQANDYAMLSSANAGESLLVTLETPTGSRAVTLVSAVYDLVPVTSNRVLTSAGGRRVGYLLVKDMITQAVQPVANAMAAFRASGVNEFVLDLRYNGGGLVTVGRDIASQIAGSRGAGRTYTSLLYNDKRAFANNTSYSFDASAPGLNLPRVYIVVGERTCSASEQLASALLPFMEVVLVGRTTCGKPVGFLPHDDGCGSTTSAVNFESVNALGQGRYFDGLRPTCAASEDWSQPLGTAAEPMLAAALRHADGAGCVAPAAGSRAQALSLRERARVVQEGERPAMIVR